MSSDRRDSGFPIGYLNTWFDLGATRRFCALMLVAWISFPSVSIYPFLTCIIALRAPGVEAWGIGQQTRSSNHSPFSCQCRIPPPLPFVAFFLPGIYALCNSTFQGKNIVNSHESCSVLLRHLLMSDPQSSKFTHWCTPTTKMCKLALLVGNNISSATFRFSPEA